MVCPILLLMVLGVIIGQTSGTGPCRDIYNRNNYCRRVLNGGWCDSWGWAKQNCKKTCGHCRGVVQSDILEDVSDYELGCGISDEPTAITTTVLDPYFSRRITRKKTGCERVVA